MRSIITVLLCSISLILIPAAQAQSVTPKKKWTFLIFLNGDNSLDDFATINLKQMEKVGSNDDVNIVVQWASLSARKAVRLYIQKSTNPDEVTSPVLEDLGLTDMGDVKTLQDFIAWGVKNYPAEHYFIDVWNHGSGWEKKRSIRPRYRNISWDDISGNSIKTEELGEAMAYASNLIGHKVDIYGSDACLMAMVEVANQMSDSVDYFIGSEELEPGAGWPYDKLLADWENKHDISAAGIAKALVNDYIASYQKTRNDDEDDDYHYREKVTLSAFDLSKLPALDQSFKILNEEIRKLDKSDAAKVLNVASNKTQSFDYGEEGYRDLIDFITKLELQNISGLQKTSLENVLTNAKQLVIANQASHNMPGADGISIWMPLRLDELKSHGSDDLANRYEALTFNQNTQWEETLTYLLSSATNTLQR